MDLLSFLPLPKEIIDEIVSYGYCHPIIDKVISKYATKNISVITKKNKVIRDYIVTTNNIICNQLCMLMSSKYKINYKKLYNKSELKKGNYKNIISNNTACDFPLFTFAQDTISSYTPRNTKYYSEMNFIVK